ncbi:MAG: DUF1549 and DUF1553 domain-containing protein [Pirellulales bacterium]
MRFIRGVSVGCVCLLAALAQAEESGVTPALPRVDERLNEAAQAAGVELAALSDDGEFLRRAAIDLTGTIPSVNEVREFLADTRPDKRALLIDRLLSKPSHAAHLADVWRGLLLPGGTNLQQFGGALSLQNWLRQKFADNVSYDKMAAELLTASGQINQSGPVLFYTSLELKPEELASNTSRVFLGVQIGCAQCHNHPFDHWKQTDFWGMAAFFARLQPPAQGQQIAFQVADAEAGEVKLPGSETVVGMKFLGAGQAADLADRTRRAQLAQWMTAADNPFFAKATVNRIWSQLFGRGLVEPVDDLGAHNLPSHPELLDELSAYFVQSGFDMRALYRFLANTQAYQRTSASSSAGDSRPELFARMAVKSLSAEQLYDCLAEAMRRRESAGQANLVQLGGAARGFDQNRQNFVQKFQAPTQNPTELQAGIPQALTLMNGQLINEATDLARSDLLGALDAPFFTPEERINVIFLSTLARLPREEERGPLLDYLSQGGASNDPRQALGDVLWAVLNSAEFLLNH